MTTRACSQHVVEHGASEQLSLIRPSILKNASLKACRYAPNAPVQGMHHNISAVAADALSQHGVPFCKCGFHGRMTFCSHQHRVRTARWLVVAQEI